VYRIPNYKYRGYRSPLKIIRPDQQHLDEMKTIARHETDKRIKQVLGQLRDDPIGAFLDSRQYAELVNDWFPMEAADVLLYDWCNAWAPPAYAEIPRRALDAMEAERLVWRECSWLGILPVGTESMLKTRESNGTRKRGEVFASFWAPFPDDIYAGCAFSARFGPKTVCHAFQVVQPNHGLSIEATGTPSDWQEVDAWATTGEVRFFVVGDPNAQYLNRWREAVQLWARESEGHLVHNGPGRPRKDIPYEVAQMAYWQLVDAFEGDGNTSKPTVRDVCDRLTWEGRTRGKTRFGELTKEWEQHGLAWPPPAP